MSELQTHIDAREQRADHSFRGPEKESNLDLLTLTRSDTLKPHRDDNLGSKIIRSTTLLTAGVAGGALERSAELLTDKKATAALEFASALGLGYGLKTMADAGGRWGQAATVGTVLLGLGLAADVYNRGTYAVSAISDNWQSPENYARNKDIVGRAIGAAVPDYSLMALGGYIGLNPRLAGEKVSAGLSDLGSKAVELVPAGLRENRFVSGSVEAMQAAMVRMKGSEAQSPRLTDRLAALDRSINGGKPSYFDSPALGVLSSSEGSALSSRIGQMDFKGLKLDSIKLVETNLRTTIIPISLINYNVDSKIARSKF